MITCRRPPYLYAGLPTARHLLLPKTTGAYVELEKLDLNSLPIVRLMYGLTPFDTRDVSYYLVVPDLVVSSLSSCITIPAYM